MTREEQREEQIKQKAYEISQMYFPDSQNIWARQNIEAQLVQSACCEMVRWADENPKEGLVSIDRVCEWLENECYIKDYLGGIFSGPCSINFDFEKLSDNLRKAMEE